MSAASISQFDQRLVNQQRQTYDCVFRLFDSSNVQTNIKTMTPSSTQEKHDLNIR